MRNLKHPRTCADPKKVGSARIGARVINSAERPELDASQGAPIPAPIPAQVRKVRRSQIPNSHTKSTQFSCSRSTTRVSEIFEVRRSQVRLSQKPGSARIGAISLKGPSLTRRGAPIPALRRSPHTPLGIGAPLGRAPTLLNGGFFDHRLTGLLDMIVARGSSTALTLTGRFSIREIAGGGK